MSCRRLICVLGPVHLHHGTVNSAREPISETAALAAGEGTVRTVSPSIVFRVCTRSIPDLGLTRAPVLLEDALQLRASSCNRETTIVETTLVLRVDKKELLKDRSRLL